MGRAAFVHPEPGAGAEPEVRDPRFVELDELIAEDERQARQRVARARGAA
jgi:hypothetical protein